MKEKKNKKKIHFCTIHCAVHLSEKVHALINFRNQQKYDGFPPRICLPGKLSTNARRYQERPNRAMLLAIPNSCCKSRECYRNPPKDEKL